MNDYFLIFMHIPKTAGTSLRNMLLSSFGTNKLIIADVPDPFDYEGTLRYVSSKIKKFPEAHAIIGHFMYGIHEAIPTDKYKYITFLRDPVERILSEYFHNFELNGLLGFADNGAYDQSIFEYLIKDNIFSSNLQTKYIHGNKYKDSLIVTENNINQCIMNINKDFAFIGSSANLQMEIARLNEICGLSINIECSRLNNRDYPKPNELFQQHELDKLYKRNSFDMYLINASGIKLDSSKFTSIDSKTIELNLLRTEHKLRMVALKNILVAYKALENDRVKAQKIIEHLSR